MPHLSELQAKHADDGVTVIGATRPDPNNTLEKVRVMTEEKAEVMTYRVAWDGDGATYAAFMDASTPPGVSRGIPTAFLIDREGRVAHIGHPGQMDIPLAGVVAGTWDPIEGPKRLAGAYALIGDIYRYTGGGLSDKQREKVLAGLAEFEKSYPDMVPAMRSLIFELYLSAGVEAKVAEHGGVWFAEANKRKDAAGLNQLAWTIVDPESMLEKRDVALARKAAAAAVKFSGSKDGAILDTLARVHATAGEWKQAIEVQRKAIAAARKAEDEDLAEELEWALEEYLGEVEETS